MTPQFQNLHLLQLPSWPPNAEKELHKILLALTQDYGAERIIAFGSCVRGKPSADSDVDLCVIRRHPPDCTHPRRDASLAVLRTGCRLATDLLVLTPEQWNRHQQSPFGVHAEILEHGITLYER